MNMFWTFRGKGNIFKLQKSTIKSKFSNKTVLFYYDMTFFGGGDF